MNRVLFRNPHPIAGLLRWPVLSALLALSSSPARATAETPAGSSEPPGPRETVVHFANGPTMLEGTLFSPVVHIPGPAVVILGGSDRGSRGPLRIQLARHFAARGVAALVYDSPGSGGSTGTALLQTRHDRVKESLAAVDFLRGLPGIRSTAVGLFGGSEGADVALMAAAEAPHLAFVIATSGSLGVSILEVLRYRADRKGHEQGLAADEVDRAVTFMEIAFELLSGAGIIDWSQIEARVAPWNNQDWGLLIDLVKRRQEPLDRTQRQQFLESFNKVIAQFQAQRWFAAVDAGNSFQRMSGMDADPFFALLQSDRYARGWDKPLPDLSQVACPILGIWGLEDSFLPPSRSAAILRLALAESKHPDYQIEVLPRASHTLTVPGSATEFAPGYLETMFAWLDRRLAADRRTKR